MARKKLFSTLPRLRKRSGAGLLSDARLLAILRRIAVTHQRRVPQIFYPLRDVAGQLRAPLSAVIRTYEQLETEGLLSSIRGSRTMLAGHESGRELKVKAVVGIPVALSSLLTLQDCGTSHMELRAELQARGFIGEMILSHRANLDRLADELKPSRFDTVIWLVPPLAARNTVLQLRDRGVRVIGIKDGGLTAMACRYEIDRQKAVSEILRDWKKAGIGAVRIAHVAKSSGADEEAIESAVTGAGLECEFISPGGETPADFAASLSGDSRCGLILAGAAAAMLALRAPQSFGTSYRMCRVAFVNGPPTMLFPPVPNTLVDLVVVNWRAVAKRVVDDLVSGAAYQDGGGTVFDAESRLQVPLSDYAQAV